MAASSSANVIINCFSSLFVSQLATRLITFIINIVVTRYLTLEEYGVQAVQFELLNTAILQLSREGFRRASLRAAKASRGSVLRFASWVILFGLIIDIAICYAWLALANTQDADYRNAIVVQGAAAFVELLAEPLYIVSQAELAFRWRATAETAATLLKTTSMLFFLQLKLFPPVVACSVTQFLYGCTTLAVFLLAYGPSLAYSAFSTLFTSNKQPKKQQQKPADATKGLWGVWFSFTVQAAGKLLLAKGSSIAITMAMSRHAQGVYGLVNNLGSLVVRTLLMPFEEATFTAFSTGRGPKGLTQQQLQQDAELLAVLTRCISIVGLLAATFGPAYASTAIRILYPQWVNTEAPAALGMYSLYILLLALNGVLEAFMHGVASAKQLTASNVVMVLGTAAHAAATVVFAKKAGVAGLLAADAVNMALRIIFSLIFACYFFRTVQSAACTLSSLCISKRVLATAVLAQIMSLLSAYLLLGEEPFQQVPHPHHTFKPTQKPASTAIGRLIALWLHRAPAAVATVYEKYMFIAHLLCHILLGAYLLAVLVFMLYKYEAPVARRFQQLRKQHKND